MKSEKLYEEQVDGTVFPDKADAVYQLITSATSALFCSLKEDVGNGLKGTEEIIENQNDILRYLDRLKTALKDPDALIEVYNRSKKKA